MFSVLQDRSHAHNESARGTRVAASVAERRDYQRRAKPRRPEGSVICEAMLYYHIEGGALYDRK